MTRSGSDSFGFHFIVFCLFVCFLKMKPFVCFKNETVQVTLVGKGVCFDTGGLDIKPASGMLIMKKDMGGGAQVRDAIWLEAGKKNKMS